MAGPGTDEAPADSRGSWSTCGLRRRFPYRCRSAKGLFFFLLCRSEEKAKLLRDVMAKIEAKNEVLEYV